MLTYVDIFYFLIVFFVFFTFTIVGISDIERRKNRYLLIGQPQGSLSDSRWFCCVLFVLI